MIRIQNLKVSLDTPLDAPGLCALAAQALRIPLDAVAGCRLRKQSVDARDRRAVMLVLMLEASLSCGEAAVVARRASNQVVLVAAPPAPPSRPAVPSPSARPVVVGAGPAGLFAALTLAEAGWAPILLERGAPVDQRRRDVAAFWRGEGLNPHSNVQFGEGGAGTFSDGKLTTGIKDPRCGQVLETFAAHGAHEEILYQAKPHIGTDRLASIVTSMRKRIIALGGIVRFGAQLTGLHIEASALRGVTVRTGDVEEQLDATALILAIGHSARDTLTMLHDCGLRMEQKPFSIGVRIEHPQSMIDRSQYGTFAGHPALGAAEYKLAVHLPTGRDIYTFCMCPGGQVVAAASEPGGICTNGMSAFARDGRNANSALLVGVSPADFPSPHPLAGIELQRTLERTAFSAAGGDYRAPAQLVGDLLAKRASRTLGDVEPSYLPGVTLGDLGDCLPGFVLDSLRTGFAQMDRQVRGFAAPGALLTAPETRSSSPVRIPRDASGQGSIRGVYPTGEGAGYAGGILSAAVDGIKMAESILYGAFSNKQISSGGEPR